MAPNQVKIICDSCADLPTSLLTQYNLDFIPFLVQFNDEELRDGIDILPETFYQRLTENPSVIPTTSQVTPMDYTRYFSALVPDGGEAIYIGFSSGLSGSLQNAVLAANSPELQGRRIHVIDSLSASMGLGLVVLRAAELAAEGKRAAEIIQGVEAYRNQMCHIFTLNTLTYARYSGRMTAFAALAANVLDIKPVLHVDMKGKLIPIDKVRGRKRSLNRLFHEMERLGVDPRGKRVGISHSHDEATARAIAETFRNKYGVSEVVIGEIGPVIGTHVGPGCIAVFFEGPENRGIAK